MEEQFPFVKNSPLKCSTFIKFRTVRIEFKLKISIIKILCH